MTPPSKVSSTTQAANHLFHEFPWQINCASIIIPVLHFCFNDFRVTCLPSYAINISGQELCTSCLCSTTNHNMYLAHTRPIGNVCQGNKWTAIININYCFVYWISPKSSVLSFLYHWWLSTHLNNLSLNALRKDGKLCYKVGTSM